MKGTTSNTTQEFCWSVILELRQPMTAISGHAQRARHLIQTDPRRACEALDDVVEQIGRIDGLLLELYERERSTKGAAVAGSLEPSPSRRSSSSGKNGLLDGRGRAARIGSTHR